MNKVFTVVLFMCIVSAISSISPPKFPVTFSTNIRIDSRDGNVTKNPLTGLIAYDDAKQLFVSNQKVLHGISSNQIFNKHFYRYFDDPTKCTCFNITYKDIGPPFFSFCKHFVKYDETDSDIIWKCTDAQPEQTILISVNKKTPNVPEKIMTYGTIGNSTLSTNITFTRFQASEPDIELFRIPNGCTKVPCQNTPKKPSLLFPKFLGN